MSRAIAASNQAKFDQCHWHARCSGVTLQCINTGTYGRFQVGGCLDAIPCNGLRSPQLVSAPLGDWPGPGSGGDGGESGSNDDDRS